MDHLQQQYKSQYKDYISKLSIRFFSNYRYNLINYYVHHQRLHYSYQSHYHKSIFFMVQRMTLLRNDTQLKGYSITMNHL
mmetsp:Transcript_128706/g.191806  ORF Transcript_128706/g.191806 Transcript_128706/m.191806 type:complete len:80 (-) Transcript_128706:864-1103(-)